MSLFSQRKGIKPLQKLFQKEAIDDELKNRLWSALKIVVWDRHIKDTYNGSNSRQVDLLLDKLWLHFFKFAIDTRPSFYYQGSQKNAYTIIREFFFKAEWYEVYDFIEFVIKNIPEEWAEDLRNFCNNLLEDENATYRILENEIVEITDENEVQAIEDALNINNQQSVTVHLKRALELLADRKNPDYRNSIKESISAVEACCKYITGNSKATLGDALKIFNSSNIIHPSLEKGFSAIYGYTSDSGGIRHALIDESQTPSYSDAKFMLVACSGFVNFLITKASESGKRK